MKEFAEVLKTLIEKHIIPTIIAIVVGILAYAITPIDNWVLMKIGKELFMVLFGGIAFLIISFFQILTKIIPKWKRKNDDRKEDNEYKHKEELKSVQEWWDYLDSISDDERDIIFSLIENKNRPIIRQGFMMYGGGSWTSRRAILKSRQVSDGDNIQFEYVLETSIYQQLCYIKEKYGKLSNFE